MKEQSIMITKHLLHNYPEGEGCDCLPYQVLHSSPWWIRKARKTNSGNISPSLSAKQTSIVDWSSAALLHTKLLSGVHGSPESARVDSAVNGRNGDCDTASKCIHTDCLRLRDAWLVEDKRCCCMEETQQKEKKKTLKNKQNKQKTPPKKKQKTKKQTC